MGVSDKPYFSLDRSFLSLPAICDTSLPQVPGLYRWLAERYPRSVVDAVETMPQFVGGVRIDPDTSLPNPNGVEYDNL